MDPQKLAEMDNPYETPMNQGVHGLKEVDPAVVIRGMKLVL